MRNLKNWILREPVKITAESMKNHFVFKTDVMKFRSSDDTKVEVTAPKGSCFRINQEITLPDAVDNSKTQTYERGVFVTGKFPRFVLPPYVCPKPTDLLAEPYRIHANLTYEVPKEQIFTERDRLRYGWTYGVLVAPFKYYPKAQNFSAGASVGPYLGYRVRDRQGDSQVLAVSIGATNASVTTKNTDGTTSSSTETGFSTAAAYVVEIKDAFNIGFLAGADFFSKSKNIPNEGKLWLGLSFGLRLQ